MFIDLFLRYAAIFNKPIGKKLAWFLLLLGIGKLGSTNKTFLTSFVIQSSKAIKISPNNYF